MLELTLIFHIALMILVATFFAFISHFLKQPNLLGYIIAGIILGPIGFNLISNTNEILTLSELGIAFLLFGAGVEISFAKLKGVGKIAFINGIAQIFLTMLISFFLITKTNIDFYASLYISTAIALSSTTIVLKVLSDNFELNTLHGRLILGILIVQDLAAIILLSFLENIKTGISIESIISLTIKAGGLLLIGYLLNKFIFPKVLKAASKSQELLFLTAISTLFFFMGLAYDLGFSIAIGALVGGISISLLQFETEINGKIKALRDFFAIIFFVSLGMQISLNINPEILNLIILITALTIILKPFILTLIHLIMGYGGRTSLTIGMGLGQMSEFSFIIAVQGVTLGYLTQQLFTAVTIPIILTIALTPYLFKYDNNLFNLFFKIKTKLKIPDFLFIRRRVPKTRKIKKEELKNHTILFGAHRMGNEIINELHKKHKLVIIDYDPEVIKELNKKKYNCIYGDIYNEFILEKAKANKAKLAIITIPDDEIILAVIAKLRKMNPKIKIFTRANFVEDAIKFYEAGADAVILPEVIAGQKMIKKINLLVKNNKKIQEMKNKHLKELKKNCKKIKAKKWKVK